MILVERGRHVKNPFSNFFKKDDKNKTQKENGGAEASFVDRITEKLTEFFSAEPQKEKILRHEDFAGAGDRFYATVSARYKVAQRICVVLLVIFLLFSIFTNIRNITYGNFFYFVRDFGNAVDIEQTDYETLSYDFYQNQKFSLYRGGIAAVSPSNVSVYTAAGRRTLKSRADFVSPYVVCSDKYSLVYDMSGNSFAIYNSFSKVYTESFDYPITDAYISDSGVFALVSRSSEYKSVIYVYNDNMKILGKYSKNLYAIDMSIDSNGEKMAVLFYDVGDGTGRTVVRIYDISSKPSNDRDDDDDRILFETDMPSAFPLGCSLFDDGKLSVVTDSALTVFDHEYEPYEIYEYSGDISAFCADPNGTAVAVKTGALNDVNRIIVFDKEGKMLYNEIIRESVDQIKVFDGYAFLKSDVGVMRITTSNGDLEKYDCQSGELLVYDSSTAVICGDSKAAYVKFEN